MKEDNNISVSQFELEGLARLLLPQIAKHYEDEACNNRQLEPLKPCNEEDLNIKCEKCLQSGETTTD